MIHRIERGETYKFVNGTEQKVMAISRRIDAVDIDGQVEETVFVKHFPADALGRASMGVPGHKIKETPVERFAAQVE